MRCDWCRVGGDTGAYSDWCFGQGDNWHGCIVSCNELIMTNKNQWLAALLQYNTVSRSLDSQCMVMGAAVPGNVENNKQQIPHNIAMPPWCRCDAMSISPLAISPHSSSLGTGYWAHRKYSILHQHQDITHTASPWCRVMLLCWPGDVSMFRGFMGKTSFISHSARSQCLQSQVGSKSMRWVRCLWDHLFQTELNLNLWYENGQKFRPNIDTPCRHRWLCGSPHRRTSTRRTLFLFSVTSPDIFPIYLQIFFETSSQIFFVPSSAIFPPPRPGAPRIYGRDYGARTTD